MAKRKADDITSTDLTNKEVSLFYFKQESEDGDNVTYRCACGTPRTIVKNSGWSNLFSHVEKQHPKYKEEIKAVRQGGQKQLVLVSKKNLNLHSWLEFVVMLGLPFSIVENPVMRSYAFIFCY
jgi:hypothetical protein